MKPAKSSAIGRCRFRTPRPRGRRSRRRHERRAVDRGRTDARARARRARRSPRAVDGVSIDTRTLAPGDLFFAIKGEAQRRPRLRRARLRSGRRGGGRRPAARRRPRRARADLRRRRHACARWSGLGDAARARSAARVVAVTGSVGKTSAKEMLRVALGRVGPTHASAASYNNHWGVPLTLSRLPAERRLRRVRDRHEPRRRDHAAGRAWCGRMSR